MDTEAYRKDIEKQILRLIEKRLLTGEMSALRSKEIAQYLLVALRPHMSLDEIYKSVKSFDKHFSELISIMLPIVSEYEEKVKKVVTNQVAELIKENKIDEANILLKKANNGDVTIV